MKRSEGTLKNRLVNTGRNAERLSIITQQVAAAFLVESSRAVTLGREKEAPFPSFDAPYASPIGHRPYTMAVRLWRPSTTGAPPKCEHLWLYQWKWLDCEPERE